MNGICSLKIKRQKLWGGGDRIWKRINRRLEGVKGLRPNHGLPIDRKGGRRLHAQLPADGGLVLDELGVLARIEAGIKFRGIQSHISSEFLQVVLTEGALVFAILVRKQVIVELPESILVSGTFRSFRRPL